MAVIDYLGPAPAQQQGHRNQLGVVEVVHARLQSTRRSPHAPWLHQHAPPARRHDANVVHLEPSADFGPQAIGDQQVDLVAGRGQALAFLQTDPDVVARMGRGQVGNAFVRRRHRSRHE